MKNGSAKRLSRSFYRKFLPDDAASSRSQQRRPSSRPAVKLGVLWHA